MDEEEGAGAAAGDPSETAILLTMEFTGFPRVQVRLLSQQLQLQLLSSFLWAPSSSEVLSAKTEPSANLRLVFAAPSGWPELLSVELSPVERGSSPLPCTS